MFVILQKQIMKFEISTVSTENSMFELNLTDGCSRTHGQCQWTTSDRFALLECSNWTLLENWTFVVIRWMRRENKYESKLEMRIIINFASSRLFPQSIKPFEWSTFPRFLILKRILNFEFCNFKIRPLVAANQLHTAFVPIWHSFVACFSLLHQMWIPSLTFVYKSCEQTR